MHQPIKLSRTFGTVSHIAFAGMQVVQSARPQSFQSKISKKRSYLQKLPWGLLNVSMLDACENVAAITIFCVGQKIVMIIFNNAKCHKFADILQNVLFIIKCSQ